MFRRTLPCCLAVSKPEVNMWDETVYRVSRDVLPKSPTCPGSHVTDPMSSVSIMPCFQIFDCRKLPTKDYRLHGAYYVPLLPPSSDLASPARVHLPSPSSPSPRKLTLAVNFLSSILDPSPPQKLLVLGSSLAQSKKPYLAPESHPMESQS